tara:strand:- start:174 stop:365 length:192 start_codon:yes stop_codon:yes gene_type:complete
MKKIVNAITHPITVTNLILFGSLGLIQIVHTRAHHKMEVDVHAYCKQYEMNKPDEVDEYGEDW